MGTPVAWIRPLTALLLLVALTHGAVAANYSEYANATLQNQLQNLKVERNLRKFITGEEYLGRNAYYWAEVQVNQTVTQNWTTRLYSLLLGTIATNQTSQDNLNYAFLSVGQNSSQIYCGNASGGNCKTQGGKLGRTRVVNETHRLLKQGGSDLVTMARLRAELFKYWATWYVHTQRGIVANLNMNS